MRACILGAGVTGLTLAYILCNKGYEVTVISKDIGGQQKESFNLGPRILYDTPKMRKLLKLLNIYEEPKKFKIGFMKDLEYIEELSEIDIEEYIKKTRGKVVSKESALSQGKKEIIGWDMREVCFIERLIEELKKSKCQLVVKELTENLLLNITENYDIIYSTIQNKTLKRMLGYKGSDKNILLKDTAFVAAYGKDILEGNNYCYEMKDKRIKRITKVKDFCNGNYQYVIEIVSGYSEELLREIAEKKQILVSSNAIFMKNILTEELNEKEFRGIKLVGRYARMSHKERVDTLVEEFLDE